MFVFRDHISLNFASRKRFKCSEMIAKGRWTMLQWFQIELPSFFCEYGAKLCVIVHSWRDILSLRKSTCAKSSEKYPDFRFVWLTWSTERCFSTGGLRSLLFTSHLCRFLVITLNRKRGLWFNFPLACVTALLRIVYGHFGVFVIT